MRDRPQLLPGRPVSGLIDSQRAVEAHSATPLQQILRRLVHSPSAVFGGVLLAVILVSTVLAPWIARYNPDALSLAHLNSEPSGTHLFGTDYLGRDILARVLYGGRVSLPAALGVNLIAFVIGVPLGLIAGYGGSLIDEVVMRLTDLQLSFPPILLVVGIIAVLGPSLRAAVIAVGIASVPTFTRVARASTLRVRELEYVDAARSLGMGPTRLLWRHVLPGILDPLAIMATLNLGGAILVTSALSYLGLGSQLPTSDWGTLLSLGYEHMFQSWSEVAFPGLAIAASVWGINLLGEGISDALNPRLSRPR
jgi:peptide/nickel transport system permease protein